MARAKSKRKTRLIWSAAAFLVLGGGGLLLWAWLLHLPCERIDVLGANNVDVKEVLELSRVDTTMSLFSIEPTVIEDRVKKHAWVRDVSVTRYPTGTLVINVTEREPVLAVVNRQGDVNRYLDVDGYVMPVRNETLYDVPLIRGLRLPSGPEPVDDATILELVDAVENVGPDTGALLSDFEVRPSGEIWLHTTAVDRIGSLPVRLGKDGFDAKLDRLEAFWQQAVLTQPEKKLGVIDLRFEGQVVTTEQAEHKPDSARTAPDSVKIEN